MKLKKIPKYSIIVPIYNVEKYLERCIQSLIEQKFKNIEFVLVNDGSTDSSQTICELYASRDSRIKVVHKMNGGLSDARNYGFLNAVGEYIIFCDADDYLSDDVITTIDYHINDKKPDIIPMNAKVIRDRSVNIIEHLEYASNKEISGKEFLKRELKYGRMFMSACFNIYRRGFLLENGLAFKKGILHEDEEFTPRTFLIAKQVLPINEVLYVYVIRDNSITTQKNKTRNARDLFNICKDMEKIYINISDVELRNLLLDSLVTKILNIFQEAKLFSKASAIAVDKEFIKRNSFSFRNKLKVKIFLFSECLYYFINNNTKRVLFKTKN